MARHSGEGGFTLIELLVTVSLVVIVLGLGVPSFHNYILLQRLKSVNAQLVTDLNLARSEAVSRNATLRVSFGEDSDVTCYTLYTSTSSAFRCNCLLGPGSACTPNSTNTPPTAQEVHTVQVPKSGSVRLVVSANADTAFGISAMTGGLLSIPTDLSSITPVPYRIDTTIDSARTLRTVIGLTGQVSVCGVSSQLGATPC